MAQAPRSSTSSAGLSDDPIENVTSWLQTNAKTIAIGVAVLALSTAAVFGYRWMDASKRTKADEMLSRATSPMQAGKLPEAQAALSRVVSEFGGTTTGAQAAMLLAQVYFDQKKYQEGITALEKAKGSAGSSFSASFEGLIAAGYESMGKFEIAAEHYASAAAASKFPLDKGANQASQARNLTTAGKLTEARKIWEALAKNESLPFAQEAQVRIGELTGVGK